MTTSTQLAGAFSFPWAWSVAALLAAVVLATSFGKLGPRPGQWLTSALQGQVTHTTSLDRDGNRISAQLHGTAHFNADNSDVSSLGPGSWLSIRQEDTSGSRELRIIQTDEGQISSYRVDGTAQTMDIAARQWFHSVLPEVVRNSTFDLEARARAIAERDGVPALLASIDGVEEPHVRAEMLKQAADYGALDPPNIVMFLSKLSVLDRGRDLASTIVHAFGSSDIDQRGQSELIRRALAIGDDYEKSQLLRALTPLIRWEDQTKSAVSEVYDSISSDYDKRKALESILATSASFPDKRPYVRLLARGIISEYDRRQVVELVGGAGSN